MWMLCLCGPSWTTTTTMMMITTRMTAVVVAARSMRPGDRDYQLQRLPLATSADPTFLSLLLVRTVAFCSGPSLGWKALDGVCAPCGTTPLADSVIVWCDEGG